MRSTTRSRPLSELVKDLGEPTESEIDEALSARWKPEDYERKRQQALSAGFEAQPERTVSRETKTEPVPEPQPVAAPKWPIDFPVMRFQLSDLPTWGAWLIPKLQEQWPEVTGQNFAGMMRNWIGSNEHLFVRTENSCALSISVPHPLWGSAVVRGIFCWSRFPDEQGAELHLVQLHRFAIDWAKSRRALRFEVFEANDLTGSRVDFFVRPEKLVLRHVVTR